MNTGPLGVLTITNGKSTPILGYSPPNNLPPIPGAKPASSGGYNSNSGGGGASSAGTSGGGGGGGTQYAAAPAPDPYAKYGGVANYNNYLNNFNTQQQNVDQTSGLAGANAGISQGTSINQYLDSLKQNQKNLDNQATQNYLAKQSGNQGILDWVGQGIRSGGVMLANKNASNSSASDALARAYGQQGRQQMAGVNQQFAQDQNKVQQGEDAMQTDIAAHIRDLPAWKTQTVNGIVSSAQQQLGQIDQTMAYLSMPQRVNMEAQKQQITQDVLSKLQSLDGQLAQAHGVQPQSTQDIQASANKLFQAGTAPENAYNFSTDVPTQFQGTGPFASDLPVFAPSKNKQTA
jgi:hypothetical protein